MLKIHRLLHLQIGFRKTWPILFALPSFGFEVQRITPKTSGPNRCADCFPQHKYFKVITLNTSLPSDKFSTACIITKLISGQISITIQIWKEIVSALEPKFSFLDVNANLLLKFTSPPNHIYNFLVQELSHEPLANPVR